MKVGKNWIDMHWKLGYIGNGQIFFFQQPSTNPSKGCWARVINVTNRILVVQSVHKALYLTVSFLPDVAAYLYFPHSQMNVHLWRGFS